MKTADRSYRMYLEDILLAMKRIAEYIEGQDFKRFIQDYKTVDAVIRNFEILLIKSTWKRFLSMKKACS